MGLELLVLDAWTLADWASTIHLIVLLLPCSASCHGVEETDDDVARLKTSALLSESSADQFSPLRSWSELA